MNKRNKRVLLFEEFVQINEGIETDIKKYIKKNDKELNSLADQDKWETIYQLLYTEFDILPDSKRGKELRQTFDFIF
jgi:hypothetical protein|tara:strand:+ start:825 stop:1055 length:231 start_codon:yes stop_codon:yes gene_type:complete